MNKEVIYPTMVIRTQAETIELQEKEIERLNNIINELEKELDLNLPFKVVGVRHLKSKLQELKGVDKE